MLKNILNPSEPRTKNQKTRTKNQKTKKELQSRELQTPNSELRTPSLLPPKGGVLNRLQKAINVKNYGTKKLRTSNNSLPDKHK